MATPANKDAIGEIARLSDALQKALRREEENCFRLPKDGIAEIARLATALKEVERERDACRENLLFAVSVISWCLDVLNSNLEPTAV